MDKNWGDTAASALYLGDMRDSIHRVQDRLRQEISDNVAGGDEAADRGAAVGASAERWINVMVGVAAMLCLTIGWSLSRGISRPVARMTAAMSTLANGDLSIAVPDADLPNEIGQMARSVLVFRDNGRERLRLEAEAHMQREATESERHRTSAERAKAAAEQLEAVTHIGEALEALANGDLTVLLSEQFPEKYARIRGDFNDAIGKLKDMLLELVASTEAIQSGTLEIAAAAENLSARTEQQAASLEETAAALEQITATVNRSSEGAAQARQIVSVADRDAKKSSEVVAQAIEAMAEITQSANHIGAIIGVIDEIAFQTNLLALNAGVEAARAGDAGRGFAVVASEVRALAQRCTEAAKEIKALISASSGQVEKGVRLVNDTGSSLQRIVEQVGRINEIVADIAAGVKEQASALVEVNIAIGQMDQVTQQNAAMVEESTAATRVLSQETQQLSRLVCRFQLGRTTNADSTRLAPPRGALVTPLSATTQDTTAPKRELRRA